MGFEVRRLTLIETEFCQKCSGIKSVNKSCFRCAKSSVLQRTEAAHEAAHAVNETPLVTAKVVEK